MPHASSRRRGMAVDLCEVRSASGMPHTLDRAAASKAQERLRRSQQRPLVDRERTAKAKTWIDLAVCVLLPPLPQSIRVGLCFLVAVLISISLCAPLSLFPLSSLNFLTYLSSRVGRLNLVSLLLSFLYLFSCPLSLLPFFSFSFFFASSVSVALCASLRWRVVWRGLEVKCAGKERWWLCLPVGCPHTSEQCACTVQYSE